MNKIVLCLLLFCMALRTTVSANQSDDFLVSIVDKYGVFDGIEGIIYTEESKYYNTMAKMVINVENNTIHCTLYSTENNKIMAEISFAYGDTDGYIFSVATMSNGEKSLVVDVGDDRRVYVYSTNEFKRIYDAAVYNEKKILEVYNAGIICHTDPTMIYKLINSEKFKKIKLTHFTNCKDDINDYELDKIMQLLEATAETVSFDAYNYDYSKLVKNILYTSDKYERISDIPRDYHLAEEQFYPEGIHSVNAEFVDDIIVNIFGVNLRHIGISSMADNKFSYVNGRYYYIGEYTGDFATEVMDIIALYNLGNERFYVLFSDIYYENGHKIPEISYAVVEKTKTGYKLIKLSVGKYILSDEEIMHYSDKNYNGIFSIKDGDPLLYEKEREYMINILVGISIAATGIALAVVVFGFVLRKK